MMLGNYQVMPQNYIYQSNGGMSTPIATPNITYVSQNMVNQYPLMSIPSASDSAPINFTDVNQSVHQITNTQSNIRNIMVNKIPIKPKVIDNNNNHDNITINNIKNNIINNNNNNNNKPMAIKVVGLKPGETLPIKNIHDLQSRRDNGSYMKTKSVYQLVKIGSAENRANATYQIVTKASPVFNPSPTTAVSTPVTYHLTTPVSVPLNAVPTISTPPPTAVSYVTSSNLNQNTNNAVSPPTLVPFRVAASVSSANVTTSATNKIKTFSAPVNSVASASSAAPAQHKVINKVSLKCYKFFNYLSLAKAQTDTAGVKVKKLIQDIVDNKIGASEFCDQLEGTLNATPQPLLREFLKKSMPHFRRSLYFGELTLEGIRAPPTNVVFSTLQQLPNNKQQSLIKPTNGSVSASPNGPASLKVVKLPVTVPKATISMPSWTTTAPLMNKSMSPAIRNVSSTVMASSPVSSGQTLSVPAKARTQIVKTLDNLKSTPVIQNKIVQKTGQHSQVLTSLNNLKKLSTVSYGNVQQLPMISNASGQQLSTISNASGKKLPIISNASGKKLSIICNESGKKFPIISNGSGHQLSTIANATVKQLSISSNTIVQKPLTYTIKIGNTVLDDKKKSNVPTLAKKEKNVSSKDTYFDDLSDVMQLGNVDIDKESKLILDPAEKIGMEERSIEDKLFLHASFLQEKISKILKKHGLVRCDKDVLALVSHAAEQRLKDLVEKLAVIAEHRMDFNKNDQRYEKTLDIKTQLRFLEEVDKAQRNKREAEEREVILRASKSKSKNEELAKLKEQAKDIQRAEMEEKMTRDANFAAMQALGPKKKKPRLDDNVTGASTPSLSRLMRPRIKKVGIRDLLFVLQNEKSLNKSQFLYKAFLEPSKR